MPIKVLLRRDFKSFSYVLSVFNKRRTQSSFYAQFFQYTARKLRGCFLAQIAMATPFYFIIGDLMLAHGLYKTIRMFFLVNSLILIAMENIICNIRHNFCKMQRRKPAQNLLQAPILKKYAE